VTIQFHNVNLCDYVHMYSARSLAIFTRGLEEMELLTSFQFTSELIVLSSCNRTAEHESLRPLIPKGQVDIPPCQLHTSWYSQPSPKIHLYVILLRLLSLKIEI